MLESDLFKISIVGSDCEISQLVAKPNRSCLGTISVSNQVSHTMPPNNELRQQHC